MIYIGVDLHRRCCYMTAMDATGQILDQRNVAHEATGLRGYLGRWQEPVAMVVESCSFWPAFAEAVEDRVERLVLAHPQRVKAIASAKLKNDRVESATLAHLLRTNLLPEAWKADADTLPPPERTISRSPSASTATLRGWPWRGSCWERLGHCFDTVFVLTNRSLRRCKGHLRQLGLAPVLRGRPSDGAAEFRSNLLCLEHE